MRDCEWDMLHHYEDIAEYQRETSGKIDPLIRQGIESLRAKALRDAKEMIESIDRQICR